MPDITLNRFVFSKEGLYLLAFVKTNEDLCQRGC